MAPRRLYGLPRAYFWSAALLPFPVFNDNIDNELTGGCMQGVYALVSRGAQDCDGLKQLLVTLLPNLEPAGLQYCLDMLGDVKDLQELTASISQAAQVISRFLAALRSRTNIYKDQCRHY
eukprot:scaffold131769_cov17-Prasinocladus_malaysianus.AAC.1